MRIAQEINDKCKPKVASMLRGAWVAHAFIRNHKSLMHFYFKCTCICTCQKPSIGMKEWYSDNLLCWLKLVQNYFRSSIKHIFIWWIIYFQLKYPAPGTPDLAKRVKALLHKAGFSRVEEDTKRGLDHGAWVPLKLMYPEANIPVCQLSLQPEKDGTYHYNLGKALAPLREEGVLIIGSGSATHNLREMGPDGEPVVDWALKFDTWIKEALLSGRY